MVYLWFVKTLQINRISAVVFGCYYPLGLPAFGFPLHCRLFAAELWSLWDVCTFKEGLALELVLICNKLQGCCSSSNMQEAHCLNSGLSCIFCLIASTKEKREIFMSCNRSIQSGYFYCFYLLNITGSEPELLKTIWILFATSSTQKTCRNDCVTNMQAIELFLLKTSVWEWRKLAC